MRGNLRIIDSSLQSVLPTTVPSEGYRRLHRDTRKVGTGGATGHGKGAPRTVEEQGLSRASQARMLVDDLQSAPAGEVTSLPSNKPLRGSLFLYSNNQAGLQQSAGKYSTQTIV